MNKGSRAKASMIAPKQGKMDTSKPAGGKVMFGMMTKARKGKAVKKDNNFLMKGVLGDER